MQVSPRNIYFLRARSPYNMYSVVFFFHFQIEDRMFGALVSLTLPDGVDLKFAFDISG